MNEVHERDAFDSARYKGHVCLRFSATILFLHFTVHWLSAAKNMDAICDYIFFIKQRRIIRPSHVVCVPDHRSKNRNCRLCFQLVRLACAQSTLNQPTAFAQSNDRGHGVETRAKSFASGTSIRLIVNYLQTQAKIGII